jgi:hypothetical protein
VGKVMLNTTRLTRHVNLRTAIMVVWVAFPLRGYSQDMSDSLRTRFTQDAPGAWHRFQERASGWQGTMAYQHYHLAPDRKLETRRMYEFKQRPGCLLLMNQSYIEGEKQDEEGVLRIINPKYAFEAKRRGANKSWFLSKVDTNPANGLLFPDPAKGIEQWLTYPVSFSCVFDPFRLLPLEPGFNANSFARVDVDGKDCVRMQFSYDASAAGSTRTPNVNGSVVYDPENYWVARELNAEITWAARPTRKASTIVRMEYGSMRDGFPAIRRVRQKYDITDSVDPKKVYHGDWVYEFDLTESVPSEYDFTLAKYGLPEPFRAARRSSQSVMIVIGLSVAGLLCLTAAVVIRRKYFPRGSRPPTGPTL